MSRFLVLIFSWFLFIPPPSHAAAEDRNLPPTFIEAQTETMPLSAIMQTFATRSDTEPSLTRKLKVIAYNPIIESQGSRRISEIYNTYSPYQNTLQTMNDLNTASHGAVHYILVDYQDADEYPLFCDGFRYTDATFTACLDNHSLCHIPSCDPIANYQDIYTRFNLPILRNSKQIDELWLMDPGWLGFREASMTGPGAFYTNGAPIPDSRFTRQMHVMGFNYTRPSNLMLESFAHRVEGTLEYAYGSWHANGTDYSIYHRFDQFTALNLHVPGHGGIGVSHYPFNATSTTPYIYNTTNYAATIHQDWQNYPNLTPSFTQANCNLFGCTHYGYHLWWFSNLPGFTGTYAGKLNNWWRYLSDYEEVADPILGDLNHDRNTDFPDYRLFTTQYTLGCGNYADLNLDCQVSIHDLNRLYQTYGQTK